MVACPPRPSRRTMVKPASSMFSVGTSASRLPPSSSHFCLIVILKILFNSLSSTKPSWLKSNLSRCCSRPPKSQAGSPSSCATAGASAATPLRLKYCGSQAAAPPRAAWGGRMHLSTASPMLLALRRQASISFTASAAWMQDGGGASPGAPRCAAASAGAAHDEQPGSQAERPRRSNPPGSRPSTGRGPGAMAWGCGWKGPGELRLKGPPGAPANVQGGPQWPPGLSKGPHGLSRWPPRWPKEPPKGLEGCTGENGPTAPNGAGSGGKAGAASIGAGPCGMHSIASVGLPAIPGCAGAKAALGAAGAVEGAVYEATGLTQRGTPGLAGPDSR
mmetsp:Transcript_27693/g.78357  ORF Transcript_27693/g.78357 Transcript_27693/m.78357 type:complete len:332 (-) Transcript_27693:22-1017(-)